MTIPIQPVTDVEGCLHFQAFERCVWGTEEIDVVPVHVLITVLKNGGMLLGAYDPKGPPATGHMVGAAFWWLGTGIDPADPPGTEPKIKVCSHMVGVLPEWQGQRIGLRLKLAQRDAVLAQGLTDWVTWTYDPLYRRNGVFNLHRLGATCTTYQRNVYGELRDALNKGVPSDRCQVDWRLRSPHVLHDIQPRRRQESWGESGLHALPTTALGAFTAPVETRLPQDGRPLAVPIPEDIGAIRQVDGELSLAWRLYLRDVLEEAFAMGYAMVDCVHMTGVDELGWHYILVREYV